MLQLTGDTPSCAGSLRNEGMCYVMDYFLARTFEFLESLLKCSWQIVVFDMKSLDNLAIKFSKSALNIKDSISCLMHKKAHNKKKQAVFLQEVEWLESDFLVTSCHDKTPGAHRL